jgi:cell wall assembly regulator SMI1
MKEKLASFPDTDFSGGVSGEHIEGASQAIGLPFPPQYVQFLREFGAGGVSSEEFMGLGGLQHLNVTWLTNELRKDDPESTHARFPHTFIPLRHDGYGNYDCIDTTSPTRDGEFQIVEWAHDGGDEQECRVLAESYFDWLKDMLNMIRELDAENIDE